MDDQLLKPDTDQINLTEEDREKTKGSFIKKQDIPGKITQTIGRGEDAKNTFIYLTLRWAFWVGVGITILVAANTWCFKEREKVPDLMGDVSKTWEIVVPLITLALGYAFGKSKD